MNRTALQLFLLLAVSTACESRYTPPPKPPVMELAACPPAPPPPVCPAPVVCPAPAPEVQCPPPPVCPAPPQPPGPVELTLNAAPVEPFRETLNVTWSVTGCTATGVELIGEGGQIVNAGGHVNVANVARASFAVVDRLSLFARVACTDGRETIAGPFHVGPVMRPERAVTLSNNSNWPHDRPTSFRWVEALPRGGWLVLATYPALNDPDATFYAVTRFGADGSIIRHVLLGYTQPSKGEEARTDHPWISGDAYYYARRNSGYIGGWITKVDIATEQATSTSYPDVIAALPPAAFTPLTEIPALFPWGTSWEGFYTPSADNEGLSGLVLRSGPRALKAFTVRANPTP